MMNHRLRTRRLPRIPKWMVATSQLRGSSADARERAQIPWRMEESVAIATVAITKTCPPRPATIMTAPLARQTRNARAIPRASRMTTPHQDTSLPSSLSLTSSLPLWMTWNCHTKTRRPTSSATSSTTTEIWRQLLSKTERPCHTTHLIILAS